jgi:hypothetical protein
LGEGAVVEEYVHQKLNEEVTAIGGHYLLVKEVRLPFAGREVLYVVGHAAFDTSCCGAGGCAYALVPGTILQWKARHSQEGRAVSEVEPVREGDVQRALRRVIQGREMVREVRFL